MAAGGPKPITRQFDATFSKFSSVEEQFLLEEFRAEWDRGVSSLDLYGRIMYYSRWENSRVVMGPKTAMYYKDLGKRLDKYLSHTREEGTLGLLEAKFRDRIDQDVNLTPGLRDEIKFLIARGREDAVKESHAFAKSFYLVKGSMT